MNILRKHAVPGAFAAVLLLSGCNGGLNAQDRAMLQQAQADAQAARDSAAAAAASAAKAAQDAQAAEAEARISSEKSTRIFEHGGDK